MDILERICTDFPSVDYDIEVTVLDGCGDRFLVYSGLLSGLVEEIF